MSAYVREKLISHRYNVTCPFFVLFVLALRHKPELFTFKIKQAKYDETVMFTINWDNESKWAPIPLLDSENSWQL